MAVLPAVRFVTATGDREREGPGSAPWHDVAAQQLTQEFYMIILNEASFQATVAGNVLMLFDTPVPAVLGCVLWESHLCPL